MAWKGGMWRRGRIGWGDCGRGGGSCNVAIDVGNVMIDGLCGVM